jgi:hypothetical protein
MKEPRHFVSYNGAELSNLRLIEELMEGSPMLSPFVIMLLQNESPVESRPERFLVKSWLKLRNAYISMMADVGRSE